MTSCMTISPSFLLAGAASGAFFSATSGSVAVGVSTTVAGVEASIVVIGSAGEVGVEDFTPAPGAPFI